MKHYLLVLLIYLLTACTPGLPGGDSPDLATSLPLEETSTEAATPTEVTALTAVPTLMPVSIDTPTPEPIAATPTAALEATESWPTTPALPGLIYHDPEGVWFIDAGGQPQRLTNRLGAVPAPDLAHAYYVDQANDIWLIDLQTGAETAARPDPQNTLIFEGTPGAYPAGHATAVPSDVHPLSVSARWANASTIEINMVVGGPGLPGTYFVPALLDVDSGLWRVIDETANSDALPAVSPDGQTIAYAWSDGETSTIFFAPREGGEGRPLDLSRFTGLPEPGSYALTDPNWSPNGRQLAGRIRLESDDGYRAALVILDLETETAEIHRQFDPPQTGASYPLPVWSPDGQWIAWEIVTGGVDEDLWLFAADGSEELLVADTEAEEGFSFFPIWLNNGRSLTFFTVGWERGVFDVKTRTYSLLDLPQGAWVISWVDPAAIAN